MSLAASIPDGIPSLPLREKMADLENYQKQLANIEERYRLGLKGGIGLNSFLQEIKRMFYLEGSRRQWQSWGCFK